MFQAKSEKNPTQYSLFHVFRRLELVLITLHDNCKFPFQKFKRQSRQRAGRKVDLLIIKMSNAIHYHLIINFYTSRGFTAYFMVQSKIYVSIRKIIVLNIRYFFSAVCTTCWSNLYNMFVHSQDISEMSFWKSWYQARYQGYLKQFKFSSSIRVHILSFQ